MVHRNSATTVPPSPAPEMSPGLAMLVRVLLALPSGPEDDLARVARLVVFPSHVLGLVAGEILAAANRGEAGTRPGFGDVQRMVLAAVDMWHRLAAVWK
jgi:hypothetical protein